MSNPYEERFREKKAKKLARRIIAETIGVLKDSDEAVWFQLALRLGVSEPSKQTQTRVIEILEGIAI